MSKRHLAFEQTVLRPRAEVFRFFARPENLARITPRAMDFVLESVDTDMREGLRIRYRLRPLLGIRVTWVSRIPRYDPPHAFIDVQEQGPYASWTHTHRFEEVTVAGVAGTRVIDEIEYELPFGAVGDFVDVFVVRRKLRALFAHRRHAIERLLATPVVPATDALKVAVAGGSGFVGGAIAAELRQRGEDVTVLSHRVAHAADGLPDGMELKWADIADPASLQRALAGADALVISLAFPNSPMESPRRGHTFEAVDARGTALLVDAAVAAGVARLVYISGAGADAGSPRSWFRAKAHAEEAVMRSGIAYTIIRPTWIYGPRDISLNRFLAFGRWLPFVPLTGTGRQRLAPVFIDDVARLAADSLRAEAARDQVFEIGGPETMSMREVIRTALRANGVGRPLLPAPAIVLKLVAWPLRHLPRPPLTPDGVDFINQPAHVDLRPLLARMPRQLTPLATGLATYLDSPRRASAAPAEAAR